MGRLAAIAGRRKSPRRRQPSRRCRGGTTPSFAPNVRTNSYGLSNGRACSLNYQYTSRCRRSNRPLRPSSRRNRSQQPRGTGSARVRPGMIAAGSRRTRTQPARGTGSARVRPGMIGAGSRCRATPRRRARWALPPRCLSTTPGGTALGNSHDNSWPAKGGQGPKRPSRLRHGKHLATVNKRKSV